MRCSRTVASNPLSHASHTERGPLTLAHSQRPAQNQNYRPAKRRERPRPDSYRPVTLRPLHVAGHSRSFRSFDSVIRLARGSFPQAHDPFASRQTRVGRCNRVQSRMESRVKRAGTGDVPALPCLSRPCQRPRWNSVTLRITSQSTAPGSCLSKNAHQDCEKRNQKSQKRGNWLTPTPTTMVELHEFSFPKMYAWRRTNSSYTTAVLFPHLGITDPNHHHPMIFPQIPP